MKTKPMQGYGIIQNAVMRLKGLSKEAKSLYALLASYMGGNDYCWPTIETQANDLDCSKDTIMRLHKELRKFELIETSKKYEGTRKRHNKYQLMYIDESHSGMGATLQTSIDTTLHSGMGATQSINNMNINILNKESVFLGEMLKEWKQLTNRSINANDRFKRIFMQAIKNEGKERIKKAIIGYASSEWHKERKAWNLQKILNDSDLISKWADVCPKPRPKLPSLESMDESAVLGYDWEKHKYDEFKTLFNGSEYYDKWRKYGLAWPILPELLIGYKNEKIANSIK